MLNDAQPRIAPISGKVLFGDHRLGTGDELRFWVGRPMIDDVELSQDDIDLLAWNVANEVVNGFRVPDFNATIGTSAEAFKQFANRLRSGDGAKTTITSTEKLWLRNALDLTLKELGEGEFHTRTGHSFEEGDSLLARLNRSLANR